jgi:hypothetical protein
VTRVDRPRWDDGELLGLAVQVLDGNEACCDEHPTSSARDLRPTELSLTDVVAAGRAAYAWLDVVVQLRNVIRHNGADAEVSTEAESGD